MSPVATTKATEGYKKLAIEIRFGDEMSFGERDKLTEREREREIN